MREWHVLRWQPLCLIYNLWPVSETVYEDDMMWYDTIWYDYDIIWYDMITIWYGMVWYVMIMILYDLIWLWYYMIWLWYDMRKHDMIFFNMIWYDYVMIMICHDSIRVSYCSIMTLHFFGSYYEYETMRAVCEQMDSYLSRIWQSWINQMQ